MRQTWKEFDKVNGVEPYQLEKVETLNPYSIGPTEIVAGDVLGYKIIAVVDGTGKFWYAAMGPTTWTDERVAAFGDKISEEVANRLFSTVAYGRIYSR